MNTSETSSIKPPVKPGQDGLLSPHDDHGTLEREVSLRGAQRNDTANYLDFNPGDLEALREVLTGMGMRNFSDKSYRSSFSFVMDGPDNQIIRVRHKSIQFNPRPYCLKPIHQVNVGDYTIDILPLVSMDATQEDAELLFKAAAKDGHLFWDIRNDNMGRLSDGTPVILDADAVVPMSRIEDFVPGSSINYGNAFLKYAKVSTQDTLKAIKHHADIKAFVNSPEPVSYDWDEKQREHVKVLGLEYGKLNGVFNDNDIRVLRNTLTEMVPLPQTHPQHESTITGVILDGGYTRSEFANLATAATDLVEKGKHTDWRKALTEVHIKRQESKATFQR